jgi:hypothetical protein
VKVDLVSAVAIVATTLIGGCVTTTPAPGAAQVRIVRNAADVVGCKAVGNVVVDPQKGGDARNLTVGLGGNTLFVTTEAFTGLIINGVAYSCP